MSETTLLERALASAILGLAQLGEMVLGSDGGPAVLLAPEGLGLSNPTE